jgi:hypothetical protein
MAPSHEKFSIEIVLLTDRIKFKIERKEEFCTERVFRKISRKTIQCGETSVPCPGALSISISPRLAKKYPCYFIKFLYRQ